MVLHGLENCLFWDGGLNDANTDVYKYHFEGEKVKFQGKIASFWLKLAYNYDQVWTSRLILALI